MSTAVAAKRRVHPVDEVLPVPRLAAYGFQHVLAFYAGAVLVPIIVAGALGPVRRGTGPPHQRRPVHLRHRLDHPVGRLLEGRRPAAAAAGRHLHRGQPDDRHRARGRRRHGGPAADLRRGDRRGALHVLHGALVREAAAVLPAGRDGHGHPHHRHRAAAGGRQRHRRRPDDAGPAGSGAAGERRLRHGHAAADRGRPAGLPRLPRHRRGADRADRRHARGLGARRRALRRRRELGLGGLHAAVLLRGPDLQHHGHPVDGRRHADHRRGDHGRRLRHRRDRRQAHPPRGHRGAPCGPTAWPPRSAASSTRSLTRASPRTSAWCGSRRSRAGGWSPRQASS